MAEKKERKRWLVVLIIVFLGVIGLAIAVVVCLNVYVRTAYSTFWANADRHFEIPGVGKGFVPQDQEYIESEQLWLFSGYMSDDSPSPIYRRTHDGQVTRVFVDLPDGTTYAGHGGGITANDTYAYLTTAEGYTVIPLADIVNANAGDHVRAVGSVALEVEPAFINIENNELYAGDFYFEGPYNTPAEQHLEAPDGTMHFAVMYAYAADPEAPYGFADKADRVYSIPGAIQGFCLDDKGNIILSSSWGVSTSKFLIYDHAKLTPDGVYHADGRDVPLIFLFDGNLIQTIEAPPMAEGIDWIDGQIYCGDEAASNKYIYGKLYGASWLYSFDPARFSNER